jgi:hypothetical protein
MNRPAVIELRDFLYNLDPDMVELNSWARRSDKQPVPSTGRGEDCGTFACIGGWTALKFAPTVDDIVPRQDNKIALSQMGYLYVKAEWALKHLMRQHNIEHLSIRRQIDGDDHFWWKPRKGYVVADISTIATAALGLTEEEASNLFSVGRDGGEVTMQNDIEVAVCRLDTLLGESL